MADHVFEYVMFFYVADYVVHLINIFY